MLFVMISHTRSLISDCLIWHFAVSVDRRSMSSSHRQFQHNHPLVAACSELPHLTDGDFFCQSYIRTARGEGNKSATVVPLKGRELQPMGSTTPCALVDPMIKYGKEHRSDSLTALKLHSYKSVCQHYFGRSVKKFTNLFLFKNRGSLF